MALLFLNDDREAACFKTSGDESYLKWMADGATHSGVLGMKKERLLYLGHGDTAGNTEKVLVIDHDTIHLSRNRGISRPASTDVPAPLFVVEDNWDTLATPALTPRPVVSLQQAFHIHTDGTLHQSNAAFFQEGMRIQGEFHVAAGDSSRLGCDSSRLGCGSSHSRISATESNVSIAAPTVVIESPLIALTTDSLQIQATQTAIQGSLTVHGETQLSNAIVHEHLLVEKNMVVKDFIEAQSGVFESLTVNAVSGGLGVGGGMGLQVSKEANVSLANHTSVFKSDGVCIQPLVEMKDSLRLSSGSAELHLGTSGSNQWNAATGNMTVSGSLTLPSASAQHSVKGSMDFHGCTRMHGETYMEKRCIMAEACFVGEPHRFADLCVYGITHLSQPFYSHDRAYFERSVVCCADVKINGGKLANERLLHIPKGSLEITQGHLWVNRAPISTHPDILFGVSGGSLLGGSVDIQGDLQTASLTVHGSAVLKNPLSCQASASVAGDLKVGQGFSVGNSLEIHPGEGIVVGTGVPLTLQRGSLNVGGETLSHTLRVREDAYIEKGGLSIQTGAGGSASANATSGTDGAALRLRHRRYGFYEPIVIQNRWFKCMHIPYGRGGCTHFYIRIQGQFFTPHSTKTIDVEFGGCAKAPTTKRAAVWGQLIGADGGSADAFAKLWVYQHSTTQDFIGYIELNRRVAVGFELQIECPAYRDVFQWKALGDTAPTSDDPALIPWWKPLETPDERHTPNAVSWMARTGIGETQPLYQLDVRAEARFQSKLYQPFQRSLANALGVPTVSHGDQSYVAIGDLLEALTKKVLG